MIYLLHFDRPLGDPTRPRMTASHYLGWAEDEQVMRRVDEHLRLGAASITRAAHSAEIKMRLVGLWPGDRNEERRRKSAGHHDRFCVICRPQLLTAALAALQKGQT